MATQLDPALSKKTFNNWLKGALAVLFAKEGLTEFVQNEITDFQRDLLNTIFKNNSIPAGTTCSSCTTANLFTCPTQQFCGRNRPCKLHDTTVPSKTPNTRCPNNICQLVKDEIFQQHRFKQNRFIGPTWQNTDATRWRSDGVEIAKCYLPLNGYENKSSFADIDFPGILGIIINNMRFQNKMMTNPTECLQLREMINEDIRHSASYELSDVQLAKCIDGLLDLLKGPNSSPHDSHAKDAIDKINQLKNNTLVITASDITQVLEENVSKRISDQQREAIQAIKDHLATAQKESVKNLERIIDEKLSSAISNIQQETAKQIQAIKECVAETDDVLFRNIKEDLITYYRENESKIPAAPLVEEHKVALEDLYVTPPLSAYDKPYHFGPSTQRPNGMKTSDIDAPKRQKVSVSQIFLSGDVRYRKIYITAKAGFGKTSLSQKLTMTWCQSQSPLESLTEIYEDAELDGMKYFDLVFLLHLRDYQSKSKCKLDDLIKEMISENLSGSKLYTEEFMQRLLREKKCLVILDGLDEWAHPDTCRKLPAVPHNNHPKSCTVLTTSRPWKLGTIGLSEDKIDRHIEIVELDGETRTLLEQNAVRILNEKDLNVSGKDRADFHKEVKSVQIGDIIYIPYILLQLMCLFFGDLPIGKSKCEIYSNITEITLKRGLNKKNLPNIHVRSSDAVPNCMKKNEKCNLYFHLIMKLGKLAFLTLFGNDKESSLIFDSKVVTQYMTAQEIDFCLIVGILCQTKDNSMIAERWYKVFFQHKSIQEYFSAIYIASKWEDDTVKLTILEACSSLGSTLEMSNLFVFVCGLNPEVYTCISDDLQKIVNLDIVTRRYRSDQYSPCEFTVYDPVYFDDMRTVESYQSMQVQCAQESMRNGNNISYSPCEFTVYDPVYFDDMRTVESYQSMQVQCAQESMRNGNNISLINLHDIVLDFGQTEDELTTLKTMINNMNGNVKSLLLLSFSEKVKSFIESLNHGVFSSLETLRAERGDQEPATANILVESARTLKCLSMFLRGSSMSDIKGLTCLQTLYLVLIPVTNSNTIYIRSSATPRTPSFERHTKNAVWLADILTECADTLVWLTLLLEASFPADIMIAALTGLACLQSLHLSNVRITHSNMERLYAYISKTTTLTQLKLEEIYCSDHKDCDVTLDLHRHFKQAS